MRPEALASAIDSAAAYLVSVCQPDGSFVYRTHLSPDVVPRPRYNVLRHAGTLYALAQYERHARDPEAAAAVRRAAGFLRRCCIGPPPLEPEQLAVWSDPELTHAGRYTEVKLGGIGLTLAAMLEAGAPAPDLLELEALRKLGRFALRMQRPDGSFHSKFVPSRGGLQSDWESLYYPGEAALGLAMLAERDPRGPWRAAANRALTYLARRRAGRRVLPADHWALIATQRLLASDDPPDPRLRETLVEHARQIARSILARHAQPRQPQLRGGFLHDGRTTPTATRLEGLLAALDVLPPDDPLQPELRRVIEGGIGFLARAQLRDGPLRGGEPRAVSPLPPDGSDATARFNRRVGEVRIDYVQHALSAWIGRAITHGHAAAGVTAPAAAGTGP